MNPADIGYLMVLLPLGGIALGVFYLLIYAMFQEYGKWGAAAGTFALGWILTGVALIAIYR